MRPTLFYVPNEIAGLPMFGVGLLLAVWVAGCLVTLVWLTRRYGFSGEVWGYLPVMLLVAGAIVLLLPRMTEAEGLPIRGYGTMLLLAVVSATALAAYRAGRRGVDPEIVFSLAFWQFLAGILGARLFYVVQYWERFQRETWTATLAETLKLTQGGLVVYGSLIGGGLATVGFLLWRRLPALATCDLIAPSWVLGVAIGRVGCLLNGCCFGGPFDGAWAVTFPEDSPPYIRQAQQGLLLGFRLPLDDGAPPQIEWLDDTSPAAAQGLAVGDVLRRINGQPIATAGDAHAALLEALASRGGLLLETQNGHRATWPMGLSVSHTLPVHPTQLYETISAALLCLLLLAYEPFKRRDGELMALLLGGYAVSRFLIEAIRVDEPAVWGTGMSISQNVSLLVLAFALVLLIYVRRPLPPGQGTPAFKPALR